MSSDDLVVPEVVPEETSPPRDKARQEAASSASGCGCLAMFVTIVALIPGGCGVFWTRAAQHDLGSVTVAEVDDRQVIPSGSFVELTGTPDVEHAAEIVGEGDDVGTALITLQDAPRLVVVLREHHPLAEAVRGLPSEASFDQIDKEWKLEGRVINGGDYMPDIPSFQLHRYITEHLELENKDDARILVVGETAASWTTRAWWAFGFAIALGLLAAVGWVMTLRYWLQGRS